MNKPAARNRAPKHRPIPYTASMRAEDKRRAELSAEIFARYEARKLAKAAAKPAPR